MKTTTKIQSKKSFKAVLATLAIALATLATVGSAQAALCHGNGLNPQTALTQYNGVTPSAIWEAAGIDPNRSLSSSLGAR